MTPVDKHRLNRWNKGWLSKEAQWLRTLGLIVLMPVALLGFNWLKAEYILSSIKLSEFNICSYLDEKLHLCVWELEEVKWILNKITGWKDASVS